ncbi:hypothetical protein CPX_001674 [Candidatus Phytoplasma pruni]|uniref:Uncharacterized protein n=1 Tax=Candidatus Phytoplasma pruni TaxID=479893 RepID=A0A0M1MZN8_9MOLU|nr:hypothetical protein [Candidatus Phytoplasma pruni]KOR75351.1 hypothetical protein CPX_001674 [Candidatus Phytoplasma pruni]
MPKIKNKINNIQENKIDTQNNKFTFLFEQNQADLDWYEVSAGHFILYTLKTIIFFRKNRKKRK